MHMLHQPQAVMLRRQRIRTQHLQLIHMPRLPLAQLLQAVLSHHCHTRRQVSWTFCSPPSSFNDFELMP
jgi:hypothetical protein